MGTAFPREYRVRRGLRLFGCWSGGLSLAASVAGFVAAACSNEENLLGPALMFAAVFVPLGLGLILPPMRERVILTADAIEVRGIWRTKRLARAGLVGWRWIRMPHGPAVMLLQPSTGSPFGDFRLPQAIECDAQFESWMACIPNLDEKK